MTDPGPPPEGGDKPMWPGFLIGLLVVGPALAFIGLMAAGGSPLILLIAVVISFVLLFQRDPMLRGIGAGVLAAGALGVIVLFIACFQALDQL